MLWIYLLVSHCALSIGGFQTDGIYCGNALTVNSTEQMSEKCQFRLYDKPEVVECISRLSTFSLYRQRVMHFAFVGDSRMRQQFYSFLHLFPDYDLIWHGEPSREYIAHFDMEVSIPILRTRISYWWRHIITEDLLEELMKLQQSNYAPIFLLLGYGPHHITKKANPKDFEELVVKMKSVIQKLGDRIHVVWFYQVPVIEFYGSNVERNTEVNSDKLELHAQLARRILSGPSTVIWDTVLPLATDYIRSCKLNRRNDRFWYYRCFDYIHTGFVSIHYSSQLLFNHLCNKIVD